jgi:hypothetical protein
VDKRNPEECLIVKKEQTCRDYFEKGIKFIIDYYTKNHPFNDGTLELEKRSKNKNWRKFYSWLH